MGKLSARAQAVGTVRKDTLTQSISRCPTMLDAVGTLAGKSQHLSFRIPSRVTVTLDQREGPEVERERLQGSRSAATLINPLLETR